MVCLYPGSMFVDIVDDSRAILGDEGTEPVEAIYFVYIPRARSITPFVFHVLFTVIYSLRLHDESANLQRAPQPNYVVVPSRILLGGARALAPRRPHSLTMRRS